MNKAIILLSGGLDSLVSFGLKKEDIDLAITFDYGQKSLNKEIIASEKICQYYNVRHKIIKLDWLKEITNSSIVAEEEIPTGDRLKDKKESTKSVWVPNRNGLFLNIAAAFADSYGYENIIIGANKEEAMNFPDNTKEFINSINEEFLFSTLNKPKVIAPLINCNKNDIVKLALENSVPLELVMSCYQRTDGHCGECESCIKLKHALIDNQAFNYLEKLFTKI